MMLVMMMMDGDESRCRKRGQHSGGANMVPGWGASASVGWVSRKEEGTHFALARLLKTQGRGTRLSGGTGFGVEVVSESRKIECQAGGCKGQSSTSRNVDRKGQSASGSGTGRGVCVCLCVCVCCCASVPLCASPDTPHGYS